LASDSLLVFEECAALADEGYNRDWIRLGFGGHGLALVGNQTIVNSGTIYAPVPLFRQFLAVLDDFWSPRRQQDQPILKWVVRTGVLRSGNISVHVHDRYGPILEMSLCQGVPLEGGIGNGRDDAPVPIVHQWPRFPWARRIIYDLCPFANESAI
jgi:hypothetical protein